MFAVTILILCFLTQNFYNPHKKLTEVDRKKLFGINSIIPKVYDPAYLGLGPPFYLKSLLYAPMGGFSSLIST